MSNIEEKVLRILGSDEPHYEKGVDLPIEALEVLQKLVYGQDIGLAAKATWLASKTGYPEAANVVSAAAAHENPIVRVAAAGALRNMRDEQSDALIDKLLGDPDAGVRKVALQSAERARSPRLEEFLKRAGDNEGPG